jgi:hypothetical protein
MHEIIPHGKKGLNLNKNVGHICRLKKMKRMKKTQKHNTPRMLIPLVYTCLEVPLGEHYPILENKIETDDTVIKVIPIVCSRVMKCFHEIENSSSNQEMLLSSFLFFLRFSFT